MKIRARDPLSRGRNSRAVTVGIGCTPRGLHSRELFSFLVFCWLRRMRLPAWADSFVSVFRALCLPTVVMLLRFFSFCAFFLFSYSLPLSVCLSVHRARAEIKVSRVASNFASTESRFSSTGDNISQAVTLIRRRQIKVSHSLSPSLSFFFFWIDERIP